MSFADATTTYALASAAGAIITWYLLSDGYCVHCLCGGDLGMKIYAATGGKVMQCPEKCGRELTYGCPECITNKPDCNFCEGKKKSVVCLNTFKCEICGKFLVADEKEDVITCCDVTYITTYDGSRPVNYKRVGPENVELLRLYAAGESGATAAKANGNLTGFGKVGKVKA